MKKPFRLFCIAFIMLAACTGKAPKQGALIEGLATGLDPADKIVAILFHLEGSSGRGIQTDTLLDGQFSFLQDSLSGENRYQISLLIFEGNRLVNVLNDGPEVYLEPGAFVRIKGEGRYFRNARISSPVKDQQLQQRFIRKMSLEDWKAEQEISAHRDKVVRETYNMEISPEQRDSLRKLAKKEQDEMDRINDRLSQQRLQLLEAEEIGQYALEQMSREARLASFKGRDNRETLLRLYNRLSDEQKASPEGMEILNYINPVKTLSIGDILPPYEYVDKGGKTVRLDTFRGRWVLLDFWSRGCGPCIKAVPELGVISQEFQDKLAVVSISLDRESSWKEASVEHGIFWNDWNDPKGSAGSVRVFGTTGIPTFVLITPEGNIHEVFVGYGEGILHDAVQRALDPVSQTD